MIRRTHSKALIVSLALGAIANSANAHETVAYTYDAKGRVTNAAHGGGPNSGINTAYQYDRVDNRSNVTTSGSALRGGSGDGATVDKTPLAKVPPVTTKSVIIP